MKFQRFNISARYLLRSEQHGTSISSVRSPEVDAVRDFFQSLEYAYLYLPIDEHEFTSSAQELLAASGVDCPAEFRNTVQYFVNSQLHYIASRAAARHWQVQREARYCEGSRCMADLKVAVLADEYREHKDFNVWFESDNARPTKLRATLSEKVPVVLRSLGGEANIYVSLIYATSESTWKNMGSAVSSIERAVRNHWAVGGWNISFVVLYLSPTRGAAAQAVIDSQLMLFEGASIRVAQRYFYGSTLQGHKNDCFMLNEC